MYATTARFVDAPIGAKTQSGVADVSAARQAIATSTGGASADARLATIAIQRWEAEGGALPAISRA
jgi:hypothetical protein